MSGNGPSLLTPSAPAKPPILPLTSIRIFAAGYVVLLHGYYWSSGFDVTTWFGRFVRNGYTAVGFFFSLSGFILAYVYLNLTNVRGWLQYLLSHKLFVLLGEASYAVYWLHEPLFFYLLHNRNLSQILPWVLYVTTVLIVSILSFLFVERPIRKRILQWMAVQPAVTLKQEGVAPR